MAGRDRLTVAARANVVGSETAEAKARRRLGYRIATSIPEGTTQRMIADDLGVTQAAISEWSSGQRRMTPHQVAMLADRLNVDRAWLAWG